VSEVFYLGRLLSLPANIRLGWKRLKVLGRLVSDVTYSAMAVKRFIVKAGKGKAWYN
jgi:hypothetical protein